MSRVNLRIDSVRAGGSTARCAVDAGADGLRTLETRTPRRDLLKFAPSGTGPDASRHDDAAVALGLCLIDDKVRVRTSGADFAERARSAGEHRACLCQSGRREAQRRAVAAAAQLEVINSRDQGPCRFS